MHREEIERQKASQAYWKLHEAGKTDEARRDMARLAIIRQERAEAAKKRDAERKCKDFDLYCSCNVSILCFSVKEEAAKKDKAKN